ncbi:hypothetical protein K9B33_17885 [Sphingobium sp. 3R8]|uniref:hypothetical protein n=1 Tax=Sphingobium sp. 3R8 TaxID=2874921 RepID=UPI001CCADD7F|nr:hypothetical protein [Sphingobium sp. 3R8]MBZ9649409.1 hypothetical protein [Sphingobium sp. 3R8]
MTNVRLTVPNMPAFMVARKGRTARPGSTLPRRRYLTLDEAATDAEAEAAAAPGRVMIVFQEVLRVKAEADPIPAANAPRRSGGPGDIPPMSPGSKGGV